MCQSHPNHGISHIRATTCAHGTVHVAIGAVTLHLRPDEAALLFCTVAELTRRSPSLKREVDRVARAYAEAQQAHATPTN